MSTAEPWNMMEREAIAAGGSNSYILTDIGEVGRGVEAQKKWLGSGPCLGNKMITKCLVNLWLIYG